MRENNISWWHYCQKAFKPTELQWREPRFNEGPKDFENTFAIRRFRYIEVLFHIFYCYWGWVYRSLVKPTSGLLSMRRSDCLSYY